MIKLSPSKKWEYMTESLQTEKEVYISLSLHHSPDNYRSVNWYINSIVTK